MKTNRRALIIFSVLMILVITFSTACLNWQFLNPGRSNVIEGEELLDELIDESSSDSGESETSDGGDGETTGEEGEGKEDSGDEDAAPQPKPDPLDPIWKSTGLTQEQKIRIYEAIWDDPEADWIYSIMEIIVEDEMDETDLRILVDIILRINDDANLRMFGNTEFPCDSDIEGGFVVCTEEPLPIESGDVHVFVMKVAAEIPAANPDRFYTYSVVVDADGDPGNNFQFNPPYNWDYFQNTDRWYALNWNPDFGIWTLDVADIAQNLYAAPSAARVIVMGDIITFFIPAAEFSTEQLTYRMTAFGHDGSYSQEASCGDVSGADPTEPLTPVSGEIIILEE